MSTSEYFLVKRQLWIISLSFGILIAFFSPFDILKYDFFKMLVYTMSFIPMIKRLEGNYEMAQIVQVYFSAMWLLSPLIFVSLLKGDYLNEKLIISYKKNNFLRPIGIVMFFVIVVWVCAIVGINPSDNDIRTYLTLHTRIGLATYGFVTAIGPAFTLALFVHMLQNLNEIYR